MVPLMHKGDKVIKDALSSYFVFHETFDVVTSFPTSVKLVFQCAKGVHQITEDLKHDITSKVGFTVVRNRY